MRGSVLLIGSLGLFALGVIISVFAPFADPTLKLPSARAHRYTGERLLGRRIYQREGCWYCHSQQVRDLPQDRNSRPISEPGDYVYDRPHFLGTERTGPDLHNVGGRYPDQWHVIHYGNPRAVNPGSVMPRFDYLSPKELRALIAYVQRLRPAGVPHRLEPLDDTPAARLYATACSHCHGRTGAADTHAAKMMDPPPPRLDDANLMARRSDDDLTRVINNGVPATGMIPWRTTVNAREMPDLIRFLRTLPTRPKREAVR